MFTDGKTNEREDTEMGTMTIESAALDLEQLAREINRQHQIVEQAMRDAVAHARVAGERLVAVKARLPHGQFMAWVEAHCSFAHRTANLYMRIASEWEANWQRIADLSLREVAALLAARSEQDDSSDLKAINVLIKDPSPRLRNYRTHNPEQALQRVWSSVSKLRQDLQLATLSDHQLLGAKSQLDGCQRCLRGVLVALMDEVEVRGLEVPPDLVELAGPIGVDLIDLAIGASTVSP